ncbi:hypothetical protein BDZ97DRAFT_1201384 [Flammula alnicola]|nr:hypothetical protein BDZ97DRAFT_1201384 [Flammula alnicola]
MTMKTIRMPRTSIKIIWWRKNAFVSFVLRMSSALTYLGWMPVQLPGTVVGVTMKSALAFMHRGPSYGNGLVAQSRGKLKQEIAAHFPRRVRNESIFIQVSSHRRDYRFPH